MSNTSNCVKRGKQRRSNQMLVMGGLSIWLTAIPPSFADTPIMTLPALEDKIASSLRLKAATSQIDYARHLLRQEQAKEGAQIYAGLDVGRHRQIVTDDLTRTYSAIAPHVGLRYPLLGGRTQQLKAVQDARTQVKVSSIELEENTRNTQYAIRNEYVGLWQLHQAEKLTQQYVDRFSSMANAAEKLREKGLWTDSNYLQFAGDLAAAREGLKRFHVMQKVAVNNIRSIVGPDLPEFKPISPGFPAICPSNANLAQSVEKNSPSLRKLGAQLESLLYERNVGAGSSMHADVHLNLATHDEYTTGRRGYAATVGASINMPANFQEAERANLDRMSSAVITNRTLSDQTRLDLQASSMQALENFHLAQRKLEVSQKQATAAHEAMREAQMQFDRVPRAMMSEVLQKLTLDYQSSLRELEDQGDLFRRTNDILLIAPDTCSVKGESVSS